MSITGNGSKLGSLVKELKQQVKTFIRQELQLAKTEISEKISSFGKNMASIAIGGFVAYAGLIIFLAGLSALLAFAFQRLGLDPLLAAFVGLGIIGLLIIALGAIMLLKGINALKKESLVPQKTIETLRHLNGTQPVARVEPAEMEQKKKLTSEEVEASVMAIENEMAETLEELGNRLTFTHARIKAKEQLRSHPYRWGLVALGTGLCGSYLLKRKFVGSRS
jgi:hypothetical protein